MAMEEEDAEKVEGMVCQGCGAKTESKRVKTVS